MNPRLPSLHLSRLLTAPAVRPLARGEGRAVVAIDGLVCGLCAARARRALAGVEGVRGVEVDLDRGVAAIECGAEGPPASELRAALEGVVIGMGARRWVARLAGWRRGAAAEAA